MSDNDVVVFELLPTANKHFIAVATLNVEKTLNSLNLAMIRLLQQQLNLWQADDDIACIVLKGRGDKAFCAGGDVVALHDGSAAYDEALPNDYCQQFFAEEYALDFHIHRYNKPIVVWGNGIVMGGGLGLMSGAAHRVVTQSTRMAMPEITIGLFPDVGGTWFLNHAPGKTGLFLGLTGSSINANDALFVGLADRFIEHQYLDSMLQQLCTADWQCQDRNAVVSTVLRQHEQRSLAAMPAAQVLPHLDTIGRLCDGDDLAQIAAQICAYKGTDKWLSKAAKTLARGCAVTAHLVAQQMQRGKHLSLADVFRMELTIAANCARRGHFKEGVRALLIDKDRNPQWKFTHIGDVPEAEIEAFFQPPWSQHPLAELK